MSNSLYPSSIDSPQDPTASQFLNNPSHSAQHGLENDAIVALETKVGVDSSAVTTTIDYLLKSTSSIDPGHKHSFASLTGFSVTSPATGDILTYNGSVFANKSGLFKYGGNGSNGALNISSGTTTINLGNAAVFVLNYTSISITGSAVLAFSNPNTNGTVVIIKSQGNVTITSTATVAVNCSGLGGQPGGVATAGNNSVWSGLFIETGGGGGTAGGSSTSPAAAGGTISSTTTYTAPSLALLKYSQIFVGSAGGGGAATGNGGGAVSTAFTGGAGGGALIIECGGAFNFGTGAVISVAGVNGASGTASGGSSGHAAVASGAGGGGGGYCLISYNSLTANSGTITITGGTGGTFAVTGSGVNTCSSGGGGGAGITSGTASSAVTGGTGVASSNGGAGASGFSMISQNSEYA
jgi:hypothetical protein